MSDFLPAPLGAGCAYAGLCHSVQLNCSGAGLYLVAIKAGASFATVGPLVQCRAPMIKLPPPIWALFYSIVLGGALAVTAARLFRREGTEINPTSPANRKLVTSGPYSFTRNPMYLGLTTISLGVAFWVGWWPMFLAPVVTFATANWAHIPSEEEKMRRQFADAFDTYARKVRRWL
jgi:protein-S-isoprenylcysteine O-methyltransferase Ste14